MALNNYDLAMNEIEKIKLSGLGYYSYAYSKGISFNDSFEQNGALIGGSDAGSVYTINNGIHKIGTVYNLFECIK